MGETTKIGWTDHTFNPWIGCTPVSAACDNCYAQTLSERYGWAEWGAGKSRHRTSETNWKKPLAWDRKAGIDGVRRRVFCASLADVFDAEVPTEWRLDLMQLIRCTPNLDWLLLTKRPKLFVDWRRVQALPANVWAGTTVESQDMLAVRMRELSKVPARIHFLSVEPMLGPVEIGPWSEYLDWIICGGESGAGHRPINPAWARSLRDECQDAGLWFFFKQWGGRTPQAGGKLLDGREWCETPEALSTLEV